MISDMCVLGAYGISPKAVEVGHTVYAFKVRRLIARIARAL